MPSHNGKRPRRKGKRKKTTAVVQVAQPHGGALNAGGTPGNVGGPGRPAKIVRQRARDSFYTRIPILEKIADNEDAPEPVRIAAVDRLGKYGLGEDAELVVTGETAKAFFDCIGKAITEKYGESVYDELVERARDLFKGARKSA